MIYGYIRVSSDRQTVENQRFEIIQYCIRENINIDGWIDETVSGTRSYNKRRLGRLLRRVRRGDIIICSELSRLGRNLYMIMEILSLCMKRECCVWTVKEGYRLGDDLQSKVLAFAFGLSAEIERNLISQRTIEALARLKAEGVQLGRPKGRKNAQQCSPVYKNDAYVRRALAEGVSRRDISRRIHCCRSTLNSYIERFIIPDTPDTPK